MNDNEFDLQKYHFELPEEKIAQTPENKRDESKLLVLDRKSDKIEDRKFYDIVDYFEPGDLLVMNNTKVFPARLLGQKPDTNAKIEIFLLEHKGEDIWETLARPAKRLKKGNAIEFVSEENPEIKLEGEILEVLAGGRRLVKFHYNGDFYEILEQVGHIPLPPYIGRGDTNEDKHRYQTVYAEKLGAAAAPTAGFHFTDELLTKIREKGVEIAFVTLHVGIGTFRPIEDEDIREHKMHSEYYIMPSETALLINRTRRDGGRIFAVGTTSCRTLETVGFPAVESCGYTNIFIYPPYEFKVVDRMITNFHLPGSSLIVMVSAFAGRKKVLGAYAHAIKNDYRFYSYGDSMLIF